MEFTSPISYRGYTIFSGKWKFFGMDQMKETVVNQLIHQIKKLDFPVSSLSSISYFTIEENIIM